MWSVYDNTLKHTREECIEFLRLLLNIRAVITAELYLFHVWNVVS